MTTILFLLAIGALVLGPKKSLALSRTAGEWYRKAQAVKEDLEGQLRTEFHALEGAGDESGPRAAHAAPPAPSNHQSAAQT